MLKVTTEPEEIITVEEVAGFIRADFSEAEEALIEALITSARQWCEEFLCRAIGVQDLELRIASFPINNRPIILRCPVADVESVVYKDLNGDSVTMDAADYIVSDAEPSTIRPIGAWPYAFDCDDAVVVTYSAGYSGGSPCDLPRTIRTAMLMLIADMYTNREAQVERQLSANPTVERLLSLYRLGQGQ